MNLFLHGVEAHIHLGDTTREPDRGERYDVVLTNPPFGTKGANQAPDRDDFTVDTSNKLDITWLKVDFCSRLNKYIDAAVRREALPIYERP